MLSEKDKEVLKDEKVTDEFVAAAREHFHHGNVGLAYEWRVFVGDWGFELETVEREVRLWRER
jgi:hypothetical protein